MGTTRNESDCVCHRYLFLHIHTESDGDALGTLASRQANLSTIVDRHPDGGVRRSPTRDPSDRARDSVRARHLRVTTGGPLAGYGTREARMACSICTRYQAGASMRALARRERVSRDTIAEHLRKYDVPVRSPGRPKKVTT
jgi:hypothetical protein